MGTTDSPNNGDVVGSHGMYDLWLVNLDILTGINEINNAAFLKVYPQPFSEEIHIQFPTSFPVNKFYSINLVDLQGKIIKTTSVIEGNEILIKPISNFEAGWYLLEFILNDKPYYFKLLKM